MAIFDLLKCICELFLGLLELSVAIPIKLFVLDLYFSNFEVEISLYLVSPLQLEFHILVILDHFVEFFVQLNNLTVQLCHFLFLLV